MRTPKPAPTLLDRAVAYINPRAGLDRLRARGAFAELARAYEGAQRGTRLGGWKASGDAAATIGLGELERLRNRSRYVWRNVGWAKQAVRVVTNNVVGRGIVPRVLAIDPKGEEAKGAARALWRRWAVASTEAHSRRRLNLYGVQRLAMRSVAIYGEVLIRRRPRLTSDGLSVPLQLEVLPPDFLDATQDRELPGGGRILGGIEFDALDNVKAYHLFRSHPGDVRRASLESRPVPASEILHLFEEDEPGQVRGVPHCAAALVRLRDLDETEDARVIREKIAACFVAFVMDVNGDAPLLGGSAMPGAAGEELGAEVGERMTPGMIGRLNAGQSVTFGNPPAPAGFEEFSTTVLRGISAAYGITYEELSNDYSRVNFSSGRMGWLKADRQNKTWQDDVMVAGFCLGVWNWWLPLASVADPRIRPEGLLVSWDAPRREMLDPVKETNARVLGVQAGFQSVSDAIREGGRNPDEVFEELAQDADRIDELGLTLSTDPRRELAPAIGGEADEDEDEEKADPRPPARTNGRAIVSSNGHG